MSGHVEEILIVNVRTKLFLRKSLKSLSGIDACGSIPIQLEGFDSAANSSSNLEDGIVGFDERLQTLINSLTINPCAVYTTW